MMKAMQIPSKGEKMKLVEIPVPQPGDGQADAVLNISV